MAPIKSIEHFRVKPRWVFVKIIDEDGFVGWGESTLEGHDLAVEGALDEMVVRLIGKDAKWVFDHSYQIQILTYDSRIEHIWQLMWRLGKNRASSGRMME